MMLASIVAALHYLALALGLGSIVARGRALRSLGRDPASATTLDSLFLADNLWGVAALLWISTGLWRALGLEKGWAWYSANPMFWLKMGLFGGVFLLELAPMITLVRWRIARGKKSLRVPKAAVPRLVLLNQLEVALIVVIPFVASMMARGIGLG